MIPKKLPHIPKKLFNIPCTVVINQEGISEDGEPLEEVTIEANCIFVDKAKQVMDAEKHIIRLEGQLILDGDIAPSISTLGSGTATVHDREYKIYRCYRPHNPDGTVHHTEVEVM